MSQDEPIKQHYAIETLLQLNIGQYSLEISSQGRGLFFNQINGEILSLNSTGAFLVQNIRESISYGELQEIFSQKFSLSKEASLEDIQDFLNTLNGLGLLKIS